MGVGDGISEAASAERDGVTGAKPERNGWNIDKNGRTALHGGMPTLSDVVDNLFTACGTWAAEGIDSVMWFIGIKNRRQGILLWLTLVTTPAVWRRYRPRR